MRGMKAVLQVLAMVIVFAVLNAQKANSQFNMCADFVVAVNPGVVMACPKGDGDPLTAPVGGGSSQITLTIVNFGTPIPDIPAEDMWLSGCTNGLLLCGGSAGSSADAPTNAQGRTTFSRALAASGCDTGLYVVVQGAVVQDPTHACVPLCVPIATRSVDYKSTAGCPGDNLCPDGKVDTSDFAWFITHYPTAINPGAPYSACADFAAPLGAPIGLPDFTKFTSHYFGNHRCNPL